MLELCNVNQEKPQVRMSNAVVHDIALQQKRQKQ